MNNNPYMPIPQRPERYDKTWQREKDWVWQAYEHKHFPDNTK